MSLRLFSLLQCESHVKCDRLQPLIEPLSMDLSLAELGHAADKLFCIQPGHKKSSRAKSLCNYAKRKSSIACPIFFLENDENSRKFSLTRTLWGF